ncbi:hypothetical protein Rs2_04846 [Raphanus sativus]|nr:hypothetical protein Rs2_04846 [Raphanus sativus]
MLKAQVNILELEKPITQPTAPSILKESDQEVLALKRAMAEQERSHKEFEAKFNQLSEMFFQEKDKSKLLENQLAENLKKIKMLSTGTKSLDHLLTLGECPSTSRGLGFQGSTFKSDQEGRQVLFVKKHPRRKR